MKRGLTTLGMLGTMVMLIIVISIAVALYYQFYGNAEDALEGFSDCGKGLITSGLSAYGERADGNYGKCSPTKRCGDRTPSNEGDVGYFYQYIGKGWGCPENNPYCCLRMPEGSNPVSFRDIQSAALNSMQEGGWYLVYSNGQISSLSQSPQISYTEHFGIFYKPTKSDNACTAKINELGTTTWGRSSNCYGKGASDSFTDKTGKVIASNGINIYEGSAQELLQSSSARSFLVKEANKGSVLFDITLQTTTGGGSGTYSMEVTGFSVICNSLLGSHNDCRGKTTGTSCGSGLSCKILADRDDYLCNCLS